MAARIVLGFRVESLRHEGSFTRMVVILFACPLVLSLLSKDAAWGSMTFADSTFDDGEWSTADFSTGAFTFTAGQIATGGNLDAYREVSHLLGSAPIDATVAHTWSQATYTPSVQGAIDSLDFSIDYLSNPAGQQGFAVALFQDGKHYRKAGFEITDVGGAWTPFSVDDRQAMNFVEILPDASTNNSSHPDFSSSGSTIVFGFVTANTISIGSSTAGYDNFSVTVHPVPEPSSILIVLSALATLCIRAWRERG